MTDLYKSKSITLPEELIDKSMKTYVRTKKRTFDRTTFSEVVREALYLYNSRNGK